MRRKALVAAAVVAVVAVVAGGVLLTTGSSEPSLPRKEATAFLAAWAKGDASGVDALTRAARGPTTAIPAASADQARLREDLGITDTTLELQGLRRSPDGALATVAAVHTLRGLGEWPVRSTLRFVRDDDRWLVDWDPSVLHPEAGRGDRFQRERNRPERAPILGAGGQPLTTIGKVVAVGVQPSRMADPAAVAAALQQHLGVDPARLDNALKQPWVKPDHFVGIVDLRQERFAGVEAALRPVPGVVFQRKDARITPAEGFAAHTIGRTGEITAEQLEQLGPTYQAGDVVGRSGLELAFERRLAGTPSGEIRLFKTDGSGLEVLHRFPGQPAEPLAITLRPDVQRAADAALDGRMPQAPAPPAPPQPPLPQGESQAPPPPPAPVPAALVAVDAATGEIVAVSSRPLGEPLNRALSGRYPPGSTFKIVTTDAIIASAGGRADQRMSCPAEVIVGGKRFRNFEGEALGEIALRDAFVHSCNTAFAPAGERVGTQALVAAAARYGFGADYRVGLGRATGGSFPAPRDAAERAAAAIGQGRVLATPAHMASVIAAATNGAWRAPHLLAGASAADAATAADATSSTVPTASPTPQAVDPLRDFLRGVVTEGTAKVAARVPDLVGKTGTAEFGSGDPLPTHAWFVGERNGIAFAVLLEGGGVGGRDAAPVGAAFAAAL